MELYEISVNYYHHNWPLLLSGPSVDDGALQILPSVMEFAGICYQG
jgi:hypothetical protein